MRTAGLVLLVTVASCARTPHAWQNPATGELAPAPVVEACQTEAQLEANRSVFLYGWGGPWVGLGWGRGVYAPGWGFGTGLSSVNMAIIQRTQELTAFCMRIKGYAWLPLGPATGTPRGDAPSPEAKP
jgi:hypothetical protein